MRTRLALLLMLSLASNAYALGDQEILYVRPVGACPFNGDGSAYTCAESLNAAGAKIGLSNVLWSATDGTANQVDPNDILYICGTHLVSTVQLRLRPSQDGNATDGAIITDGACPNDPGTIDGENAQGRLVWWDTRLYHTLKNITVRRSASDYAISAYDNAQQDRDRHLTLDHVIVRDNSLTVTAAWFWGGYITVTNSQGINNTTDNFYFKGGRDVTFEDNACTEMAGPADCFQQDATSIAHTGTVKVNRNYCDKTGGNDIKYCYLVGPVDGVTEIIGNYAACPVASVDPSGCSPILVDTKVTEGNVTTAALSILRNLTNRGWRGITVYRGVPAERTLIVGNVVIGAGTLGLWANSTVDNVLIANNTFVNNGLLHAGASGEHAIYLGKFANPDGTSDVTIANNIFAGNYSGIYYVGSMGIAPSYNAYYGQVGVNIEKAGNGSQAVEASALTDEPRFLDVATYRLDGPSTLRGAGTAVTECIALDGLPCTTPPSIGAYQYHHGGAPGGVLTDAAGPY